MTDQRARGAEAAAMIAGYWVVVLVALSIGLFTLEEVRVTTNAAYHRAMAAVVAGFVAAPFVAGLAHRSLRIAWFVALFGLAGLFAAVQYGSWAYTNIGGGP